MNDQPFDEDIKQIAKYLLEILEEILTKKIKISSADFNKFLYLKKLEEERDYDIFFSNTYFDTLLKKYNVDMEYIRKGIENIKEAIEEEPTELFIITGEFESKFDKIDNIILGGDEISFQFQNRRLFFDTLDDIKPYNLIEVFGPSFDEQELDKLLSSNDEEFVKWVNSQYKSDFKPVKNKHITNSSASLKEKIDLLLKREKDIVDN